MTVISALGRKLLCLKDTVVVSGQAFSISML